MPGATKLVAILATAVSMVLTVQHGFAATGTEYPLCTDENKERASKKTKERCKDLCYNEIWSPESSANPNLCPCFLKRGLEDAERRTEDFCVKQCTECLTESALRQLCGSQCGEQAGGAPNPVRPGAPVPGNPPPQQPKEQCVGGCVYKGGSWSGYCTGAPGPRGWDYISECPPPENNVLCHRDPVSGRVTRYRKPQCGRNQSVR